MHKKIFLFAVLWLAFMQTSIALGATPTPLYERFHQIPVIACGRMISLKNDGKSDLTTATLVVESVLKGNLQANQSINVNFYNVLQGTTFDSYRSILENDRKAYFLHQDENGNSSSISPAWPRGSRE